MDLSCVAQRHNFKASKVQVIKSRLTLGLSDSLSPGVLISAQRTLAVAV